MSIRTAFQIYTPEVKSGICKENKDTIASFNSKSRKPEFTFKQAHLGPSPSLPPPPPPPPPTRESSVAPDETEPPFKIIKDSVIPRGLPELRRSSVLAPDTSFLESSAIRETLPRTKKLQTQRGPIAEVQIAIPSRQLVSGTNSIRPLSEFFKSAKRDDNSLLDKLDQHEHDAAVALMVLKDCSAHVTNMTKHWSQPLCKISLCDFIVAQKKCQTMLENIETLKDAKIQARETTAVEDGCDNHALMGDLTLKKRNSFDLYKARSKVVSSRSSSIVSIVNAMQKDGDKECRHQSSSTDRTLTKSPIPSNSETPRLASDPYVLQSAGSFVFDREGNGSREFTMQSPEDGKRHMGKIGKTSKSGKNRNTHMKCLHCAATDTPEWRKGPVGPTTLCNACGLFFKKLVKKFGPETASVIMKSRQDENPQDRKVPRSFCA